MKRKMPDPVTQRVWRLNYFFLLVRQTPEGMVVESRHKVREVALKKAQRLVGSLDATYGVLTMIGNPTQDYLPGDILNPKDVSWRQPDVPDRCSMCCHPYNGPAKSLDHRCHIFRDNPPCVQVQSLTVRKRETGE